MIEKPVFFNGGITAALCSSRITISPYLSVSEQSANNAFNFNGNNGNLNNNNKNNTYSVRGVAALRKQKDQILESYPFPLSSIYESYYTTRKNKGRKASRLIFDLYAPQNLINLCIDINENEYRPTTSTASVITKPKYREVIAADFRDRIVQTLFVQELLPQFEQYEHPYSFACRVGKGGLAAVKRLVELSHKYNDGYVCFVDFQNHFGSIDTKVWTPRLVDFIKDKYPDGDRRGILIRLAETIYYHRPQDDCIFLSPLEMWEHIPKQKSLFGRDIGIPIGNLTSQALSNFITTSYLEKLSELGLEFAFYTDDTGMFSMCKRDILNAVPILRDFLWNDGRITLHPDKFYLQQTKKGFNALGFRVRGTCVTPSKRIVHNFHNLVSLALRLSENPKNLYWHKQQEMADSITSYLALLSQSRSFGVRMREMKRLHNSPWAKVLTFPAGMHKVGIKKSKTPKHYFIIGNRRRRRKTYNYLHHDNSRTNLVIGG